jgi:N-carbamoyl-L-amino-acid hydrolase
VNPDPDRLWDALMDLARIGATEQGGCARLALTNADSAGRQWLAEQGRAIGLSLRVDRLGNMSLLRPGADPAAPPVAIGSHLDTVPTGGRFDGAYGVLAGLEVLRALHASAARTVAPLMLINWTNEEGARFAPPMSGSETAMGFGPEATFLGTQERDGTATIGQELARTGWVGDADPALFRSLGAYFEAHIEQGPLLEQAGAEVGIVTHALGVQALRIVLTGRDGHVGSPMAGRADALAAAAELTLEIERLAMATGGQGIAAVTRIEPFPNARGNIVSSVALTTSPRHHTQAGLEALVAAIRAAAEAIGGRRGIGVAIAPEWGYPFVAFDTELIARLRSAAARHRLRTLDLATPIGHDAIHVARVVPGAMLFIPCHGGISHNPAESITREWCAAGLRVLCDAVLETAELKT